MLELRERVLALLFVATAPVAAPALAAALDAPIEDVDGLLRELSDAHDTMNALVVTRHDGCYRLVTSAAVSGDVKRFLQADAKTELSRAALETLSIVAYRGPLTRSAVEAVRGVNSEAMVRTLLQRGLIMQQGTAREPGRPPLYTVSQRFLEHLGLRSLNELPPLPEARHET